MIRPIESITRPSDRASPSSRNRYSGSASASTSQAGEIALDHGSSGAGSFESARFLHGTRVWSTVRNARTSKRNESRNRAGKECQAVHNHLWNLITFHGHHDVVLSRVGIGRMKSQGMHGGRVCFIGIGIWGGSELQLIARLL
jgi:hypothetical protein